ncbi:hypothetical protein ACQCN2_13030 [Brevibacillus ginsengisoli]|uniref:hypothetical protein n=1 Tax=Brevibacillus ginsengisoli TaxID=363854 RepID=UPI003CE7FEC6
MGAARGLIVEGIPGSGKTSTIRQLQKLPEFGQRESTSFLLFGEEITQRTLELRNREGLLSVDDHESLLGELLFPLEQQQKRFAERGWNGEEKDLQFLFLFERFHLTHATYYSDLAGWNYQPIEERLSNLSAKGCLLVMSPEVMQERIIDSRPFTRWRNYIARYGDTNQAIIEHYVRQQEALLREVKRSLLDWLVVDTTQANWSLVASELWKYWNR